MKDCLPSLMSGLHMIWVLSTYYCTDSKMVPLLQRIAVTLVDKVRNTLIAETLFR